MLGVMTMDMSLIVLNYESSIPHSLAIYGVWKIMDFHSNNCEPRHPKQTPTITFIVIVDSQEWVPNAP